MSIPVTSWAGEHVTAHKYTDVGSLVCSDAVLRPQQDIDDLPYDAYSPTSLTTDWTVPKSSVQAASYDVTYGLQTGTIGIGEPAPNFSGDAVIDNEITEYVFVCTSGS